MEANYDLSFVEKYDNYRTKFKGQPLERQEQRLNDAVVEAFDGYSDAMSALCDERDVVDLYPSMNDDILSREGFTRGDWSAGHLPAYVEASMHDESRTRDVIRQEMTDMREEFMGAVYHVDSILTDDTRKILGDDYRDSVVEQHAAEREAAARENGARSTHFNRETGESYLSLVDEHGMATDDPYAFDEFD